MSRLKEIITVALFLSELSSAQQRSSTDEFLEHYWRELAFREIEQKRSNVDGEIASRRYAQYLEQQFIAKVNRFVALWSALVHDYNEKRVFNIKLADEVTKAFHEVETSDGWRKPASKAKR